MASPLMQAAPHVPEALKQSRELEFLQVLATSARAVERRAHVVDLVLEPSPPDRLVGSTFPDLVAITSPSRGVKPIVVSTERPSRTAASDAPAPRWQVTTRRSAVVVSDALPRCVDVPAPGLPGDRGDPPTSSAARRAA